MKKLIFTLPLLLQLAHAQTNSLNEQFANPMNLTDEQALKAKNFVHEGQRENFVKSECAKKGEACKEPEGGMQTEDMIRMAYNAMGMFRFGTTLTKKDPKPDPKQPQAETTNAGTGEGKGPSEGKKEEQTDYCMMAAVGFEAVAGMMQGSMQRKVDNETSAETDIQLKALVNLRETHKARAKTSSWQSVVYTGVTACYGWMLLKQNVKADLKFIIKMGGAGALAVLYGVKANKHKENAKKVQEVINSLDKVGKACDPYTKTSCFCAEKSSQTRYPTEYQEVCILNKGNPEGTKFMLSCVSQGPDKKVAMDEKCDCKKTNTCLRSPLKPFTGGVGVGANLMAQADKTFDLLGKGEFDRAQLDKAALDMGNMAAKMKIPEGVVPEVKLTETQKKAADGLQAFMNPQVASFAAAARPSSAFGSGISNSGARATMSSGPGPAEKAGTGQGVKVDFTQGGGLEEKATADAAPEFVMPGMAKTEESENTEIVTFAEKAVNNADVSNAPSTPIFDLISNRYRISGWRSLDTEGK